VLNETEVISPYSRCKQLEQGDIAVQR
jgi:hypothetical protein